MSLIQFLAFIYLIFISHVESENSPCMIREGFMKSARIEFNEDTSANSLLFSLPFIGKENEISINFKSNELNETLLQKYFQLKSKEVLLKTSYNLDEIRIDLIELVFTCSPRNASLNGHGSSNMFLLYVTINDVNNKRPEFIGAPYDLTINEFTPIGTIVYKDIKAIDKDLPNKPNSQISFSIEEGECSDYFEFPLTTKSDLAVRKLIKFDDFNKCRLLIKVEDHGYPQLSSETAVEINIVDIDDKDPLFSSNLYSGSIRRNSLPGSLVTMPVKLDAIDQDTGINSTISYKLTSNPNDLFKIDSTTGQIYLKHFITDFDRTDYNLIVKAVQVDNQLKSALTMVKIEIIDVNEHAPQFEKELYEAKVVENAELDTFVCQINAIDSDQNRIEYSIVNNHESPFLIDRYTGDIRVNGRLDYEMKNEYTITVSANDGIFTATSLVKILLINIVDKAPQFEFNNYNFKLKIPYDVYIGQVRANDVEKTNELKYSILLLDLEDSGLFCISQNGIIYMCPSSSHDSSNLNKNSSLFNLNDEELKLKFKKSVYRLNVSVSIFSKDLMTSLENHVECKIEIEKNDNHRKDYEFLVESGAVTTTISTGSFIDEQIFKDPKVLYVFIAIVVGSIILMIFCMAASIWFRCSRSKKKTERYLKNQKLENENGLKFFPNFGLFDSHAIENGSGKNNQLPQRLNDCSCSCSSHTSDSCKNSTSGISCLSDSSAVFNNQDHIIKMNGHQNITKIPALSDYFNNNEVKVMKSSKFIGSFNHTTNDDPMLMVRQETGNHLFENKYLQQNTPKDYYQNDLQTNSTFKLVYETSSDKNSLTSQSKTLQVKNSRKKGTKNNCSSNYSTSSSLLMSSSCSSSPKGQRTSPLLLSFQPPNTNNKSGCTTELSSSSSFNNAPVSYSSLESGTVDGPPHNPIFNYREPLSVNSETKFEDEILIRNYSKIIPLEIEDDNRDACFRDHLDTCNNSLAKMVNIMKSKSNEANSEISYFHEVMPSDRSLVSASIDRFTDCEKDEEVNKLKTSACKNTLNDTFLTYNHHSEPPQGFRDTSNTEEKSTNDFSIKPLITNSNIISIKKNDSKSKCMSISESATDACESSGSRICELKKQLGIQSEFFFNQADVNQNS